MLKSHKSFDDLFDLLPVRPFIVEVGPGRATLSMTVRPEMVNGQRIAHGGFIFLLADSTFAFACNSHNQRAVAAQCDITFIRPGKLGDVLVVSTDGGEVEITAYPHTAIRPGVIAIQVGPSITLLGVVTLAVGCVVATVSARPRATRAPRAG